MSFVQMPHRFQPACNACFFEHHLAARNNSFKARSGLFQFTFFEAGQLFRVLSTCMVHIIAAMAGLSAIIASSSLAFDIIKYIGAAYLIYLGIRAVLSKKHSLEIKTPVKKLSYKKIFWQGFLTNVLNPKVALFFLAFLPQFIDIAKENTGWQILFLGTWFDVGGTLVNIVVALLFGKIGQWLNRSAAFVQWQQRITGTLLIALGIKVALSSRE